MGVGNGLNLGSFELERARCGDEAETEGFGRRFDRGLMGGGTEGMSTSSDSMVPDTVLGVRFQSSRSSTGAVSAMRLGQCLLCATGFDKRRNRVKSLVVECCGRRERCRFGPVLRRRSSRRRAADTWRLVAGRDKIAKAGEVIVERRIEVAVARLLDSTRRVTRRGRKGSEPHLRDKAMKRADRLD